MIQNKYESEEFKNITPRPISNKFRIHYYDYDDGDVYYSISRLSFPEFNKIQQNVLEDNSTYIYIKNENIFTTKYKFIFNGEFKCFIGTQQEVEDFIFKQLIIDSQTIVRLYNEDISNLAKWLGEK